MGDILNNQTIMTGIISSVFVVIGVFIERFAPKWIPFVGIGKQLADELLNLHLKAKEPNSVISARAIREGNMKAWAVIEPHVDIEAELAVCKEEGEAAGRSFLDQAIDNANHYTESQVNPEDSANINEIKPKDLEAIGG